jgi:hypothetical protein
LVIILLILEPTFLDKPSEIDTIGSGHTFGILILGLLKRKVGIIPVYFLFGIIALLLFFVAFKKYKRH